jgi:acylphosphatase
MSDGETQKPEKIQLNATVSGRVQGVGFRYYASSQARRLGLRGWVRNQPDGSVQIACEGPRAAVTQFHRWLESGPPSARVDRVEAYESPYRGQFKSFSIDY